MLTNVNYSPPSTQTPDRTVVEHCVMRPTTEADRLRQRVHAHRQELLESIARSAALRIARAHIELAAAAELAETLADVAELLGRVRVAPVRAA